MHEGRVAAAIMAAMAFAELYSRVRPEITSFLHDFTADHIAEETLREGCLHLLGRGKLIRPVALIAAAETFRSGIQAEECIHAAAAMELVHTFTLVHDDLPELDDAKLRRGVDAVHVKFGTALALLVGDALFNLAFAALQEAPLTDAGVRERVLRELVGSVNRVIEGQVRELALSGQDATLAEIEEIERLKTACLLECALVCGAIVAGAEADQIKALREFALTLGHAYQIKDDLLSATGDSLTVGKSLEQDEVLERPTVVRLLGVEGAQARLDQVNESARDALERLATTADVGLLRGLHEMLAVREK
jgi:geranylgeranyl diphosphate synthase type II